MGLFREKLGDEEKNIFPPVIQCFILLVFNSAMFDHSIISGLYDSFHTIVYSSHVQAENYLWCSPMKNSTWLARSNTSFKLHFFMC